MEEKNSKFFKYFMTVLITAVITCMATTFILSQICTPKIEIKKSNNIAWKIAGNILNSFSGVTNNGEDISLNDKLYEIKSDLDKLYVGEYDEKKLIDGALEGYVAGVGDQYTEYLNEEEIKSLQEDVNGSYVGVGLYIAQNTQTNQILVIGVIEDSPGHKAGILAGDVIKKIDGVEYTGDQLTQASNKMKGVAGSKVVITVERDGEEKEIEAIREEIKFKTVKSEELENNIGYIKISSFGGETADDFKKAYEELQSKSIKSLIIDLRQNGGGLVDQSLSIAEMIVPKGSTMLITTDKNKNEEVSKSNKEPIINVPIVILVDEYTASASEILTAAVKENTNTKVIGTKTYGKGVIQGIYLLKDKKTGLKITIQEYFTPNHNKLNKVGITPDEIVELPDEWKGHTSVDKNEDTQLKRAIECAIGDAS